ncbi:MAG TPA: isopentenyl-diphosphate Delta-isomerase [Pyrinomonadaceae bacterium]|nr:isopentenyl-diphosphate Delta-isomerase [Pyrinomonadaceae bacterium]
MTAKRLITIALLAFLAIGAYFMVNVPLPPWSHWLSGLNVVLFAIPAIWVTRRWLGWYDAIGLWGILGVYAICIETLAIFTGFPYGHFGYSELLGFKLFGVTPWTVFLAWTPLMLGAYAIAANLVKEKLLANSYQLSAITVVFSAVIATAFDLVLDPGAVRLGFWQYEGGGWWYDVPWSNFGGWLMTAAVGSIVIELFQWIRKPILPVPTTIAVSAALILWFWTFIAYWSGSLLIVYLSGFFIAFLIEFGYKRRYKFDEMLVLCDDTGKPISTTPKSEVHTSSTPLHLAFSIFIFNSAGDVLLQQRAFSKQTWPGVWSNSCCGHQMLHERPIDGAKRRLKYELGLTGIKLECVLPDFQYRAELDGIVENEICPVFVGYTDKQPSPNKDEVETYHWQPWGEFIERCRRPDTDISPWAVEEAELLEEKIKPRTNTN